jgi:hypothetical protein
MQICKTCQAPFFIPLMALILGRKIIIVLFSTHLAQRIALWHESWTAESRSGSTPVWLDLYRAEYMSYNFSLLIFGYIETGMRIRIRMNPHLTELQTPDQCAKNKLYLLKRGKFKNLPNIRIWIFSFLDREKNAYWLCYRNRLTWEIGFENNRTILQIFGWNALFSASGYPNPIFLEMPDLNTAFSSIGMFEKKQPQP